ncbi:MAG: hypothetical protein HYZ42_14790 [Bacteroidetes bacterium]|nr:hypothetical protein [Bacteroidota bacterium]
MKHLTIFLICLYWCLPSNAQLLKFQIDYQGQLHVSNNVPSPISFKSNKSKLVYINPARYKKDGTLDSSVYMSIERSDTLNILNLNSLYNKYIDNHRINYTKISDDSLAYHYYKTYQLGCGLNTVFTTYKYKVYKTIYPKRRSITESLQLSSEQGITNTNNRVQYNKLGYKEYSTTKSYAEYNVRADTTISLDSIAYLYKFDQNRVAKLVETIYKQGVFDSIESHEYYYAYNEYGQLKQKLGKRFGKKAPSLATLERTVKIYGSIDSLEKANQSDIETTDYIDSITDVFTEQIEIERDYIDSVLQLYDFEYEEYQYTDRKLSQILQWNSYIDFARLDSIIYDQQQRIKKLIVLDDNSSDVAFYFDYDNISGKISGYKFNNLKEERDNEEYAFEYDKQGRINKVFQIEKQDNEKYTKTLLYVLLYKE